MLVCFGSARVEMAKVNFSPLFRGWQHLAKIITNLALSQQDHYNAFERMKSTAKVLCALLRNCSSTENGKTAFTGR